MNELPTTQALTCKLKLLLTTEQAEKCVVRRFDGVRKAVEASQC